MSWCRCSVVALALSVSGCVETAECDATTVCEGGEVCFQFACRPRCDEAGLEACGADLVCASCARYDACHGASASACVAPSVIEELGP